MYMKRCLQLASLARAKAAPNPMVGAVIVHNGRVIGEGYHTICGSAHAEVEAVRAVADDSLLKESTLYVSLEPCSHFGKTPPCAALIIEKKIPRVVVGTLDPFPAVSGRGVGMLQDAGIEVEVGVLEEECRELNKSFFCFQENKRPYIILKWAQSKDGFIDKNREAVENPLPTQISNELTRMHVHKLRSEVQSILVGTNTAIKDNPSLTVRFWSGNNPLRLVVDRNLRIPSDFNLLMGDVHTLVFTHTATRSNGRCEYISLKSKQTMTDQIMEVLYRRKIQSVLIEGGSQLLQSFIDAGMWDEVQVEVANIALGDGVPAPCLKAALYKTEKVGSSELLNYRRSM